MNILLDFIPFQSSGGISGAASYTKAVYDEVFIKQTPQDSFYAIYDSSLLIGGQYNHKEYAYENNVLLLDISQKKIAQYIIEYNIDTFFIALGQLYGKYALEGITCKTIMGIHDIWDIEREDNKIELTIHDKNVESTWMWTKRIINTVSGRYDNMQRTIYKHIMPLYVAQNTFSFTVSNYTRNSLCFYFKELSKKDIHVLYSPSRKIALQSEIENEKLQGLIKSGKKFLFMLAANRRLKNAHTLIKVYQRLLTDYPDLHLLTLRYGRTIHSQHIDIPFLSDSDLEYAYKHCYALVFGSYFEGFGYPPIEALRHETPCVASNVTSIPEILGDAGIFFSPFYPADLYRAIKEVLENRDCRKQQIKKRFIEISKRQNDDLGTIVDEIYNCHFINR